MEIVDYFRTLGSRCWVMILAPLVAGILFAGFAFHVGHVYQANAVIQSPTLVGVRSAQSDGNQYSTELQSALQVQLDEGPVLTEISRRTGISVAKVKSGLSVGRRKPSSFAVISYSGGSAKKATAVARAAAEVAYGNLLSYEQEVSFAPVNTAEARLAAARLALVSGGQQPNSAPDPTTAYIVVRYEVARLESSLAQHLSNGNTVAAQADEVALAASRQKQAEMVGAVGTHQQLVVSRDQARTARDVSFQQFIKAQNRLNASALGKAIHIGVPKKQIPVKDMTIIGGAAVGVALAIVLIVQWLSETRRWLAIRRHESSATAAS